MKLNDPGRQKLKRQNSWQQAKHEKLYSYLLIEEIYVSSDFSAEGDIPVCPCVSPAGSCTITWWGCSGLCLSHKLTELAHSFSFCFCVCFCLYGPFNCISFHKFSRQLSAFSLCSSGLISALFVLSTIYLFMKVSFSLDILCG